MEMTDDVDAGSTENCPSIGDRRAGWILVCMGDDRPDELIDWLDALVNDFEELKTIADEHVVKVNAGSQGGVMNDWSDFCRALGEVSGLPASVHRLRYECVDPGLGGCWQRSADSGVKLNGISCPPSHPPLTSGKSP